MSATNPDRPAAGTAAPAARRDNRMRLLAAGIHLGLSAVIFAVTIALMVWRWYPGFHFGVDGGWQGARIMAVVDLVVGPLLTLVIFDLRKARRLIVFDLTCIGLAQLAALVWGFYAVLSMRPVSMNYYAGVVYSMPARSARAQPQALATLAELSSRRPPLVYVAEPDAAAAGERAAAREALGLLAHEDAAMFRAFAPHWPEIQEHALDPAAAQDELFVREVPEFLARHGGTAADYRFIRYQGGYGSCLLAFDAAGELREAMACLAQ